MQARLEPPTPPRTPRAEPEPAAATAVHAAAHGLPPTLGIPQAARYLGISRATAYRLAACGELPVRVVRVGNSYRVPTTPLLELLGLTSLPAAGPAPQPDDDPERDATSTGPTQDQTAQPAVDAARSSAEVAYRRAARIPVHCPRTGR